MRKFFLPVLLPLLALGLFVQFTSDKKPSPIQRPDNVTGCAPGNTDIRNTLADGKFIPVLPGWGNHAYQISTTNDSAQFYFNQGLSMYYSYHKGEAIASFREAARFDSSAAMAWWGQALAAGPSYNFSWSYKMKSNVPGIVAQMNKLAANASPKERDLMEAITTRYSSDTTDSRRPELNEIYARHMEKLVEKYPGDLDIKALYVDAVMLMHEWDFWHNDGSPKVWTPVLVKYCEEILKANAKHPAALHYYIHVTEASRNPGVALASADQLKDLMPGVAHMVHMSSHEYERIGMYAKGVAVNEQADEDLVLYDSLTKHLLPFVHVPHYFAVEVYCALSGGMYKKGLPKAYRCRKSVVPDAGKTYQQYLFMFPELMQVRLGKWNDILQNTQAPDKQWVYASILYDFAKGMAYAHTGQPEKAAVHLTQLHEKMDDNILKEKFSAYMNTPYEVVIITGNILEASILFARQKHEASIACLKKAILAEDSLIYVEPKQWMIPARQYLGAFLLKMNKPAEAENVYREDLIWNPGNGWSLLGLYKSLVAQGKQKQAAPYKPLYLQSFSQADELPPGSVY